MIEVNLPELKKEIGVTLGHCEYIDHFCDKIKKKSDQRNYSRYEIRAQIKNTELFFELGGWVLFDGEYNPPITFCPDCGEELPMPPDEMIFEVRGYLVEYFKINGP